MDGINSILNDARILIIDDEETNVLLLQDMLEQAGYCHIKVASDPRQALPLFMAFNPDIVLLDLHMPHLDGYAIMHQITSRVPDTSFLPILVITGDLKPESRQRALKEGASDFLNRSFDSVEVLLRIRNLLHVRLLQLQVQHQNQLLENRVHVRTNELEEANLRISRFAAEVQEAHTEILERLAVAAEYRDDDTGQHVQRVSQNSALLTQALGLPSEEVELIRKASTLHDVGKIGVSDTILLKPGRLTSDEFDVIKTHTTIGARILSGSRSPLLQMAEIIALTHHEKWDGTGYSPGLAGDAIPLAGRIVAVVDVFDALTHKRPYKEAWPIEEALREIQSQAGRHFDPDVVEAFSSLPHQNMV